MAGKGAFNAHSKSVVGGSPSNSIATKHGSKLQSGKLIGPVKRSGKAGAKHGLSHGPHGHKL
jgi:hypothetical protein